MFLLMRAGYCSLLTPDSTTAITALGLEWCFPGPASLQPSFPTGSLRTGAFHWSNLSSPPSPQLQGRLGKLPYSGRISLLWGE